MAQPKQLPNVPENFTERNLSATMPRLSQYERSVILASVTGYLFLENAARKVDFATVQRAYANAFAVTSSKLYDAGE